MLATWWAGALAVLLPRGVVSQWQLHGHSIRPSPPDVGLYAADWYMTGTVIPSKKALVVQPGAPVRQGALWSRRPIKSNDFEVKLDLTVEKPEKTDVVEQGFVLWYVYENGTEAQATHSFNQLCNQEAILANTWQEHMRMAGFDLLGYRSKFNGLGLFFIDAGDGPEVSAIANKGDTEVQYKHKQSFPNARKVGNWANGKQITVNLRVKPNTVKVEFEGAFTYSWELPAEVKADGYIGITTYGGNKGAVDSKDKSNIVKIWELAVTNYDQNTKGEEKSMPVTAPPVAPEERADVLHESSSFKDHRQESDAIKELTNTVFKLVMETQPLRVQMTHAIDSLTKRVEAMENTFQSLKDEIDKKTGHHLSQEFDLIKKELSSLSTVASQEHKARKERLDVLHKDITHVHKVAHGPDNLDQHLNKLTESNQRTLDQLTSEHQRMFGVSLSAIAFVVVAGLSLYNKFRCWEKKHVL